MGSQLRALAVTMAWVVTMVSMAAMVWMAQGGIDVEVLLVLVMVASNGGVDGGFQWWRRWLASMVDWGLRHRGH